MAERKPLTHLVVRYRSMAAAIAVAAIIFMALITVARRPRPNARITVAPPPAKAATEPGRQAEQTPQSPTAAAERAESALARSVVPTPPEETKPEKNNTAAGDNPKSLEAQAREEKIREKRNLKHLSWQQFESALVSIWGSFIEAQALNGGRRVHVRFPAAASINAEMIIDRENNSVQFVGSPSVLPAWSLAMQVLDRKPTAEPPRDQIVGLGRASSYSVRQAVAVLGLNQDDSPSAHRVVRFAPPASNNPLRIATIPQPLQDQPQEDVATIQPDQDLGLTGPVRIQVLDELGALLLIGAPEDVEKVKKIIEEIARTAIESQPQIELIPLYQASSSAVRDIIQQIYTDVYEPRQGPVSLTALEQPNALLVIGQPETIDVIKALVEKLDTPTPPGVPAEFKVYRLRFMSALDAKARIDQYFTGLTQAQAPVGAVPQAGTAAVTVVEDYRSNTLIVKASPRNLQLVDQIVENLDVMDSDSVDDVRILTLRNALAEELAPVLQNIINGQQIGSGEVFAPSAQFGAQQQQQLNLNQQTPSRLRATMLQLKMLDENGRMVKSDILFGVRVTADRNSNSLVITGPSGSMDLIETLVRMLDRVPDAETQIKVFTVINGDATTLLQTLQALFGTQNQQVFGLQGQTTLTQLPLQTNPLTEGASLLNLRFGVDTRTNSIIASGHAGDLRVVEDLLIRLDEEDVSARSVSVYRLSNAPANDVAAAINQWLDTRRNLNTSDPSLVPLDQIDREIIVVPEVVSNSLIVSALPEYQAELESVIQALDRRPPMIKIKVLIAQVNLNRLNEFGLEFGIQDSLLFDRGITGAEGFPPVRFPFNQPNLGNDATATSLNTRENLAGQALVNLNIGRVNSELGYGGLVVAAQNESINFLLRSLRDRRAIRILSKPHIMTVDNLQSRVQIGAQVPTITGVSQTTFGITNEVVYQPVGVILQVTPRVSPDGTIIMLVDAINSRVGDEDEGIPIFINNNGNVIRSPQIETQEAQTTIIARSGQTVVISGLIQEIRAKTHRGFGEISDWPIVGPLFGFRQEDTFRQELLFILTPYLVDNDEQLEAANQAEMDRMHWCIADVANMYGSLGYGGDGELVDSRPPIVYFPDEDPFGDAPSTDPTLETIGPGSIIQPPPAETPRRPADPPAGGSDGSSRDGNWQPDEGLAPVRSLQPMVDPQRFTPFEAESPNESREQRSGDGSRRTP